MRLEACVLSEHAAKALLYEIERRKLMQDQGCAGSFDLWLLKDAIITNTPSASPLEGIEPVPDK